MKFTAPVRNTIVEALRNGLDVRLACGKAGISHVTFYRWMERGEEAGPKTVEHQFYLDVQRALAEFAEPKVTSITEAGKKDWKAAAWLLERRFPEQWGRQERAMPTAVAKVELAFPGAVPIPTSTVTALPPSSETA